VNANKPVVIVTGSSGLIGTSALDRVRTELGDRIASVIHLAAYYDFSGEPSSLYDAVTVQGTERLLRLLRPFAVEQFVLSSTILVHAPCEPGQHINEESPLDAGWDYPESKLRTERLIRRDRGKTPIMLLRIAGVYTDRCESIPLAHQIQRIYERRLTAHVFPGDPSRGQSFGHLADLVQAFRSAVAARAALPSESIMLVGEPDPMGYDKIQRTLGRRLRSRRQSPPAGRRPDEPMRRKPWNPRSCRDGSSGLTRRPRRAKPRPETPSAAATRRCSASGSGATSSTS
jgi:nucleoside-diphosphate-sugar epimerase